MRRRSVRSVRVPARAGLACWAAAVVLLGLFGLPAAASPGTCNFTAGIDNDWNTPGNWTCSDAPTNRVPTADDDVVIPNAQTAILNSGNDGVARSVTLQNGGSLTVGGNKTLTVGNGASSITGGDLDIGTGSTVSLAGSLVVNAPGTTADRTGAGTLTVAGATNIQEGGIDFEGGTTTLNGATSIEPGSAAQVINSAKLTLGAATSWTGGALNVGGGTTPGGLLEIASGASLDIAAATPTLNNLGQGLIRVLSGGLLQRITSPTNAVVEPAVDNDGQVTALVGRILLRGGSGGETSSGTYTATAPGALAFDAGNTHLMSTTARITGTGTVLFSGGSVTIPEGSTASPSPYDPAATELRGGSTFTLGSNGSTGSLLVNAPFTTATKAGAGTLTVTGTTTVQEGGVNFAGGTTTLNGATSIAAGPTGSTTQVSSGAKLTLAAATTWTGGGLFAGGGSPSSGLLEIASGANLDIAADNLTVQNIGQGLVRVLSGGLLQRSASGTGGIVEPAVDNDGQVTSAFGRLTLGGGSGGETSAGTYTATAPGTVAFGGFGGNHVLGTAARITGDGTALFNGGSVTIPAGSTALPSPYNPAATELRGGGTLSLGSDGSTSSLLVNAPLTTANRTGAGTLTVNGATNIQEGGVDFEGGTTTLNGATSIEPGSATQVINSAKLTLAGATSWTGGILNVGGGSPAGGLLEIASGVDFDVADRTIGNLGQGTVGVLAGGVLSRSAAGTAGNVGPAVANQGTVRVDAGRLTIGGGLTQAAGLTDVQGNELNGAVTLDGGTLKGTGTLGGTVSNNGGTVAPGASPGTLTVTSNYTQGSGGTLQTEVAGTTPGTQFDQLIVSGDATLDGTLAIVNSAGFDPALTDTFEIVQTGPTGRTGTFSNVTGAALTGGKSYAATYNPDDVTLTVAGPPPGGGTTPPSDPPPSGEPGGTPPSSPGSSTGEEPLIVGGCLNAAGKVSGKRLGPARLGRGRKAQRAIFKGANLRTRRDLDRYCARGGGTFRIGYPTARLNRTLGRSLRRKVNERVVVVLTSSRRFSLRGIKRGTSETVGRQRLGRSQRIRVGRNVWYVAKRGATVQLLKTQTGVVREIGIGDRRLTGGLRKTKRFLRTWELD